MGCMSCIARAADTSESALYYRGRSWECSWGCSLVSLLESLLPPRVCLVLKGPLIGVQSCICLVLQGHLWGVCLVLQGPFMGCMSCIAMGADTSESALYYRVRQ